MTSIAPLNPSIIVNKFTQEYSEDSSADSNTSVYSIVARNGLKPSYSYAVLLLIKTVRILGRFYDPSTTFAFKINYFTTRLWA